MAKHTIKGFVTYRTETYYQDSERIHWTRYDPRLIDSKDVLVCEQSIEVDVPDDFDPRGAQVALLRKEQKDLRAKFAARINELDDRINSLLALEMA